MFSGIRTARALSQSIRILDSFTFAVPRNVVHEAISAAKRFILGYNWLVHANMAAGKKQYKVRPKRLSVSWCAMFLAAYSSSAPY